MDRRGILVVISGPSGVGKGSIREILERRMKDIQVSVSATTRPARAGEVNGTDYFFVDEKGFREMIASGAFLEYACVYGNYYGTPRDFVLRHLEAGRDVLLEIDIQGARQVREKMPEGVFIFIKPPGKEELARRLRMRGKDSEEMINRRLVAFEEEMNCLPDYDYEVLNDELESAVRRVEAIILAERSRAGTTKDKE